MKRWATALLMGTVFSGATAFAQLPARPVHHASPGVTEKTIRFATIVAGDVSKEDRDAMLAPLEHYFRLNNNQVKALKDPKRAFSRGMAERMLGSKELASRSLILARWVLKGPPATWSGQLEAYYRKEPVFALVGGITNGEWKPIHQFSERHELPSLFPITDFPVVSDTGWYTLYLSKGYAQEGESVAGYLNGREELAGKEAPVVQVVGASREGQALASGFQRVWKALGRSPAVTVALQPGEALSEKRLAQLLAHGTPAALLVWDGPKALPALESLATAENRPGMVFVSSRFLGESVWTLGEKIRDFTFIAYPFVFSPYAPQSSMGPAGARDDVKQTLPRSEIPLADRAARISALTNAMTLLLTSALMDMNGYYSRDNFLDAIDMMPDQPYPVYGRISFGSGHRYAAKGCFITKLSKGEMPELVKVSGWVAP